MITKIKVLFLIIGVSSFLMGCASQKPILQTQLEQAEPNYLNPLTYLDAANEVLIEMTGFWDLGMGTVDYVGDKTEETHQYIADVYQSL